MTPVWWHRPIVENDFGRDVAIVQRKLGLLATGYADASLSLVVRGYQKGVGLVATGVVDEETASELGEQEGFGLLPTWFTYPAVKPGDKAYFFALNLVGCEDENGIKRFQGDHHLPATGVIDETTARILAGLEVESWTS
jgi:hypothetical protein